MLTVNPAGREARRRLFRRSGAARFQPEGEGGSIWKSILIYGSCLAAGTLALEWLDYQRLVRDHSGDIPLFMVAFAFLALGIFVGMRAFRPRPPQRFDGNPKARDMLGISRRELEVLEALAAGRSNKEIANALCLSPHTVKTHVGRLFDKLGAKRRTDGIHRARELGILR
jgi:DNA-binding CsgD family transcriptional regulator